MKLAIVFKQSLLHRAVSWLLKFTNAARQISAHSDVEVRVVNYVGGTDKARQIEKLASNQPHIVIGTPGRIYDLVKSGDLAIHKAKTFVVDEADMTLDMGFLETVDKIAGSLPKDLQFMVFSATIPQKLQPFLKKYLSNPCYGENQDQNGHFWHYW